MQYLAARSSLVLVVPALIWVGAAVGCTTRASGEAARLPAIEKRSNVVGPGDTLEISIVGEKDLPKEYVVESDGSIGFPWLHDPVKVTGREPREIAALVRERLVDGKFLTDPSVMVLVRSYASKKIVVGGAVIKPDTQPWHDGMTITEAISKAGGFNALAQDDDVVLTRTTENGADVTVHINVREIMSGKKRDLRLQWGDRIQVDQRIF